MVYMRIRCYFALCFIVVEVSTVESELQKKHFFVNTKEIFLHILVQKKRSISSVSINSKPAACNKHITFY